MFESDKKSALDRLKKGLYSRNTPETESQRHSIHGEQVVVPESWENASLEQPVNPDAVHVMPVGDKQRHIYKIIFMCSGIFFLIALAVAAYTFFGGGNYISVDNVDILIDGPASIGGGEPLSLNVSVVNKNQTEIQLVDLVAEYPQGTKDSIDPTKDLSRVRLSLGNIGSQSVVQKPMNSVMFGQEGDIRDIKFTAEYRTADSNAIFFKEKIYHVTISSSPVTVLIDTLDKASSGEPFDMAITIGSNTTDPVKNVLMSLDYPFGFTMVSSDPAATYGDNIWDIGDLAPGAKRVIHIRASASGQDGEDKTIHANVGIQSTTNEREMATTIVTRDHSFTIEKPFLGLDLALDGSRGDVAVEAGRAVRGDIIWTNNSSSVITGAKIVAKLNGTVLNKASVSADSGGFYDSQANTITWQAGRSTGLDSIAPGADGRVGFSVSSIVSSLGQSSVNPQISVAVTASGDRVSETGAPQSVNTAVTRSIKLATNLSLSARALYSQGPISNHGPIPPKVDQSTTYTIVWTVTNTSNNITGAKVTASLPPYMSWTGIINPTDANISYDPNAGGIVWNVGEVSRNADIGTGAKQVAFQMSLKPSANQAGNSPDIVGPATITGTDVFTGATIKNSAANLTTRITTDLLYRTGDEVVQK
jgi:hypothetical protein